MGAVFFAGYLLFAGQLSWSELCVALPAAVLSTAFLAAQGGGRGRRLSTSPLAWVRVAPKALASVPPDTLRVGRVLLRTLVRRPLGRQGKLQVQPFNRGGDDSRDARRRALVTLGVSLAPNGYVLDDASEGGLLLHRLRPMPPRPNRDWPV